MEHYFDYIEVYLGSLSEAKMTDIIQSQVQTEPYRRSILWSWQHICQSIMSSAVNLILQMSIQTFCFNRSAQVAFLSSLLRLM